MYNKSSRLAAESREVSLSNISRNVALINWHVFIKPYRARNPLSLMDELLSLLQPVLFWLANILEFYQFLTTHHSSLHLAIPSQNSEGEGGNGKEAEQTRDEDENPLVTLQNVMIYTFQQAFYPVSKV